VAHWLLKTEPGTYSWQDLVSDGGTEWDGVRNYSARIHLNAMKRGDLCLIYHSQKTRDCVGVAKVVKVAYPDPTALDDPRGWVCVDIKPVKALTRPVTLAEIKAHRTLCKMELVRMSRLSVSPVTDAQYKALLSLSEKVAS